jgi:hypothetical protein
MPGRGLRTEHTCILCGKVYSGFNVEGDFLAHRALHEHFESMAPWRNRWTDADAVFLAKTRISDPREGQ